MLADLSYFNIIREVSELLNCFIFFQIAVVSPVRGVPPTVLSPSKVMKLRVISGEDLRLACNVQGGKPEPVVRWLKNNENHFSR